MNNNTLILLLILMPVIAIILAIVIAMIYLTVKGVQCAESPIRCIFKHIF